MKQRWMTEDNLGIMEERQWYKNSATDEDRTKYKELKFNAQILCHQSER